MNLEQYIEKPETLIELKVHDLVVFGTVDNTGYEWVQMFATPWFDRRYNHVIVPFLRKHTLDYVFVNQPIENLQDHISDNDVQEIYRTVNSYLIIIKNVVYLKTMMNKLIKTMRDINIDDNIISEILRMQEQNDFARKRENLNIRIHHHGAKTNSKVLV